MITIQIAIMTVLWNKDTNDWVFRNMFYLSEMKMVLNDLTSIKSNHDIVNYCLIYVISGIKMIFMIFSAIVDQNSPRWSLLQSLKRMSSSTLVLRVLWGICWYIWLGCARWGSRNWLFEFFFGMLERGRFCDFSVRWISMIID